MVGWGSKLQEWCFSTPFERCVFQSRKLKHIWNKKTWEKGTAISDHTLYQHVSNPVLYFLLENTGSTFSLTKKSRQSNPHCANPRTIPELFVSNEMRHPTSQSSDPRLGYMERLHGQNSLNIKQMSQNYSWKKKIKFGMLIHSYSICGVGIFKHESVDDASWEFQSPRCKS